MNRSRRVAVWTVVGLGLAAVGATALVARTRLLVWWKVEQAVSGQESVVHAPLAGDSWRDRDTPERWLRERWLEVKPAVIAETRRGPRERRIRVLALLAFLQQDLGERLDLDVLWGALAEPAPGEACFEAVVHAALYDLHGTKEAVLRVRAENGDTAVCQLRPRGPDQPAEVRAWDLGGEEAVRLRRLLASLLAGETLKELSVWVSEPGPVSAEVYPVVEGAPASRPGFAMHQTTSPWCDEVVLRLFETVQEPTRQPSRELRPGEIPPRLLERMAALLPARRE